MRRKEKEINDHEAISMIIEQSQVLRLAMARDNRPYVVPLCFGYDGSAIYFHCAREGQKLDYLAANDQVCFEFEHGVALNTDDEKACAWGMRFQSVIGFGRAEELAGREDKVAALAHIMNQYSDEKWDFGDKAVDAVRVWKINIESMTAKNS